MITAHDLAAVEHHIDSTNSVNILLEGRRRSKRGRKADPHPYRLYMVGMLLNIMTRGNAVIEDIHTTLTERLPIDDQIRIGARRRTTAADGTTLLEPFPISKLYYVSKTIEKDLGYGQGAANKGVSDEERDRRHEVIQDFTDTNLDNFTLWHNSSVYAVDATGLWSWGRGGPHESTHPDPTPDPPERP